MLKGIKLTNWVYNGDTVKLNNTSLLVQKTDFDRAMGNIISLSKDKLTKEYMHIYRSRCLKSYTGICKKFNTKKAF